MDADHRPAGVVVITGCAHPGNVEVARTKRAYLDEDVHCLMGGSHLRGRRSEEIRATIEVRHA